MRLTRSSWILPVQLRLNTDAVGTDDFGDTDVERTARQGGVLLHMAGLLPQARPSAKNCRVPTPRPASLFAVRGGSRDNYPEGPETAAARH